MKRLRGPAAADTGAPLALEDEILLVLALRGALVPAEIARALGGEPAPVEAALHQLLATGDVARPAHAPDRVALGPQGRARARAALLAERAAVGERLAALYPAFAELNGCLKEALSAWQVRRVGSAEVPNDHADPAYDAAIIARVGRLMGAADPLLGELAALRGRYAACAERLRWALARVRQGEAAYVCGLGVDSLHALWWQLHADLLAVLGRARAAGDA